jgi:hypothetical protein
MTNSNKEVATQLIKDISTASRMVGKITDQREYLNDQALQSIVSDYRTSIKEMTQALLELVSEVEAPRCQLLPESEDEGSWDNDQV